MWRDGEMNGVGAQYVNSQRINKEFIKKQGGTIRMAHG